MAGKTRYLYIITHDYVQMVDSILDLYGGHPKVIAQKYDSYMSAAIDIELYGSGLIIYAITDMEHLKNIVSFTEGIKKFIKGRKVRIIVLHSVDHPKLKKLLRKIGCAEIFKTTVSLKFLQKLLEKYLGKVEGKEEEEVLYTPGKDGNKDDQNDVQVISGPASSLDISDEMPEADDEIEIDSGLDEAEEIEVKAANPLAAKIKRSQIKNKIQGQKPKALDMSIPVEKLDEEQKKIRSYFQEICPTDNVNDAGGKENSFGNVDDTKKKSSFMQESSDANSTITVWTRGREILVQAKLREVDTDNNIYAVAFAGDAETKKLIDKINAKSLDVLFIKLDISRGSIFFDIRNPELEKGRKEINVTIPERMWRVDRRSFHRLEFPKKVENNVAIRVEGFRDGEEIQRRILNIGAGGASLAIFPNEAASFKVGTFIENFNFSIKGQELDCCAKVVWVEQFQGDNFVSIGINFLGLEADFIETINLFILEETFEFWEKYYA
ncbi:MAG: PilZ domain-containing protein [Bacteriovoracaceae bacterium]|nr:PilZ domain-containing protein [Bacteriovoracaceae bacterium]